MPASSAAKLIAPAATIAATWVVGKGMNAGYRAVTGNEPPRANDRETPLRQAIVWALATAAALAVVNLLIERYLDAEPLVEAVEA